MSLLKEVIRTQGLYNEEDLVGTVHRSRLFFSLSLTHTHTHTVDQCFSTPGTCPYTAGGGNIQPVGHIRPAKTNFLALY